MVHFESQQTIEDSPKEWKQAKNFPEPNLDKPGDSFQARFYQTKGFKVKSKKY